MKKIYITLLALAAVAGAGARDINLKPAVGGTPIAEVLNSPLNVPVDLKIKGTKAHAPRLASEFGAKGWFGYCGDPYSMMGAGQGRKIEAAILVPQEMATEWKGNRITKVNVGFGQSATKEVTVFITESLDGEPLYTQSATMRVENGWNEVTLTTPYEFTGNAVYIGFESGVNGAQDYPVAIDGILTDLSLGDFIGVDGYYQNYAQRYGNVCLQIMMDGDGFSDCAGYATSLVMPEYVGIDDTFSGYFTLINTGLKPITGVDLTCKVNGVEQTPEVYILDSDKVESGDYGYIMISGLKCETIGNKLPVEVQITGLRGEGGTTTYATSMSATLNSLAELFEKKMVVEEFTGTWCGACPRGLVGMEYMADNYGDKGFIGIGVHSFTSGSQKDEMSVESYQQMASVYSKGSYPSAVIDRNYYVEPSKEVLEEYYKSVTSLPAKVKISLTANYDQEENVIVAESKTRFSEDENNADYKLAFAIIEDGMGPYMQSNYYSGGATGPLPGWDDKPAYVETMFNLVARDIFSAYGLNKSVPTTIKQGEDYTYSYKLSTRNVTNIDKCKVIVMILDGWTGFVLNADQVSIEDNSGVEDATIETEPGIFTVYNLQGIKVMETENPSDINLLGKGIYIINGKKTLVR